MLDSDRVTSKALRPLLVFLSILAVARFGRRVWPTVLLAGFAIVFWGSEQHVPLLVCIGVGIGLASGAWASAWLLERSGFDAGFSRAKDVPLFILCVAAGMALGPFFAFSGYYLSGLKDFAADPSHWVRWWANAAAGALLLGPLLIGCHRKGFERFAAHWPDGRLSVLGLVVCRASIMLAPGDLGRPLIVVFAFILVVVCALGLGLVLAPGALLVLS